LIRLSIWGRFVSGLRLPLISSLFKHFSSQSQAGKRAKTLLHNQKSALHALSRKHFGLRHFYHEA
jgi:hypothetical protein